MSKTALYNALRAQILAMDLAPGTALDEAALCQEHGVSRTPLRETLQRLAGEGLVSLTANRGATVSSMDLPVMRSFFQIAPMVYAAVARLAAENRTEAQLDELHEVQQQFRLAAEAGSSSAAAMSNHRFHELIGEMSGSPYLMPSLKRLLIDHTRMGQRFYAPRSATERALIQDACTQHDDMIAAFAAQKAATAVDLTLAHWALSRDRIERFVRPDPLPLDPTETVRDAI